MDTSQQTGPPSAGPSTSSSLPNQEVPARVPDFSVGTNAYYQRACFTEYLNELSEQSQAERESRLSSIATRIKSRCRDRQLPNPKQMFAKIRFNFQRQMNLEFWLRMNDQWPFFTRHYCDYSPVGTEEEMYVWDEVDELSTQLYEKVYALDQEQQNKLKQQQVDQENSCLNESKGRGQSGGSSVALTGQQNEQGEQQVNADVVKNRNDVKQKAPVRASSPFKMSLRPRSIKSSISPRVSISTTRKSSNISTFKSSISAPKPSSTSESGRKSERIQNRSVTISAPSTAAQASTSSKPSITSGLSTSTSRKSSKISTFKSSIAPKPSSTSESARKSQKIQNFSSTISAPSTAAQASTSSKPSITPTPLYSKIGNTYRCHFGECTVVMGKLYNMKRHLRAHTGAKPYRCSVTGCIGFASNDRRDVRRHIQSKHYPGTVKDLKFLNQFIETNEELLIFTSST